MKKIIFIPPTYVLYRFTPHQHERTRNSLHLKRACRQGVFVEMEIKKQAWPVSAEAVEPKCSNKRPPWSGRRAAPSSLFGAVLVEQQSAHHPRPGILLQDLKHALQRIFHKNAIGIQK